MSSAVGPAVVSFEHEQVLGGALHLPTRMTVLPIEDRGLVLVSPIPVDDALAAALAELGEVRFLVAPNLLHHLYLPAAARRYPAARVLAPAGLARKQPGLRIDGTLDGPLPADFTRAITVIAIDGAPSVAEHVLYHAATRSLVVTDLLFNVLHPAGFASLVLRAVGCHGRLARSRAWWAFVRDRAAAAASVRRLLELPVDALFVAHGEPVLAGAGPLVAQALRGMAAG